MATIFDKLNLKDQREILVINAPASFEAELVTLGDIAILRDAKAAKQIGFCLAFVTRIAELETLTTSLPRKAKGDALLWFAYPKGTSKKYQCEFNRDTGWDAMRQAGFDTVRQIAIDDDWTALRFRRVEFIGAGAKRSRPIKQ
ncbi:MAG: hypothetical protein ABI304_08430 [Rudaea sp.]